MSQPLATVNCGSNFGLFFQIVPTRVSFFFSRSRASGMEYKNYCKDNFSQNVQFFDQIFDNSCSLVYFSPNFRIFSGINLHLPCIRCVGFAYCLNFYSILSGFEAIYCRNEHLPLKQTNCSLTIMWGPGM